MPLRVRTSRAQARRAILTALDPVPREPVGNAPRAGRVSRLQGASLPARTEPEERTGARTRRRPARLRARGRSRGPRPPPKRPPPFEYGRPPVLFPHLVAGSGFHTLGTVALSRSFPQLRRAAVRSGRSGRCGNVIDRIPQVVDQGATSGGRDRLSTACPQEKVTCAQPLHTLVHCSATTHRRSLDRVKAVTPTRLVGLGRSGVILGTALGRSGPRLCTACAELFRVHSTAGLSTAAAHRTGGQNLRVDLRQCGYPRYPQALLLRLRRYTGKLAWKRALCTTRPGTARPRSHRLDPDLLRLSATYVRLVPGITADTEGQQGEPATAGGGLR